MNLHSLNSSSMQGASFDREIASGFARKAINQDGEAVRSDSSAVAVDDAQVARTTSAPVVLRVGFKAGKMTAGKHGEDPEVSEAVRCLQKSRLGYRFVKRAFDIVFSAFVLIAFSWLFAIVAIAIEIDDPRGPVIFKQKRVGKDGKEFYMYKFRSMCVDAEDRLAELRELNEKSGPVFKIAADPRITRVGKWLRKLSLASVIIGTPGAGEPTNSLSSAAKTSLDQQFYERRPEVVSCDAIHYTSPEFLSFAFFGGSRKAQNELEARADGADQGGSPWCDKAFYFMNKNGACDPALALGVAA